LALARLLSVPIGLSLLLSNACARAPHHIAYAAVAGDRLRVSAVDAQRPPHTRDQALLERLALGNFAPSSAEVPAAIRSNAPDAAYAAEIVSLKDRAARDHGCDAAKVRVLRYTTECAALVDACDARDVYLWMEVGSFTRDAPGLKGVLVYLRTGEYFPVSEDPAEAKREILRVLPAQAEEGWDGYDGPPLASICGKSEDMPQNMFHRFLDINARAARDLDCPASQVFPGWDAGARARRPITAFGEGCGKRIWYATGLGDVMDAAVVRIEACSEPGCVSTPSGER
jgi:hypothetical protein